MRGSTAALAAALATILAAAASPADVEVDWGAFVENDFRLAVDRVDEPGFDRNLSTIGFDLQAELVPGSLRFVGDLRFVWTGFTGDLWFEELSGRNAANPWYLESGAAYIDVAGLLPDLDLRIGRQIVQWGAADAFNPTNNLNALDLEDPLMFGETIANQMLRVDWNPGAGDFIFSAVWVPVFQPALLPASARLVIADPSAEFPFARPADRLRAERLRNIWLRSPEYYEVAQPEVTAGMPEFSLKNSQVGLRAQWLVGLFDMSLTYYRGRDSLPVSKTSYSSAYSTGLFADNGTPVLGVATEVELVYPEKQVLGFDLAGQLPFLDDAGFWAEGAMVFPERVEMSFDITRVAPGAQVLVGPVVESTPFFKWVAGLDYSINEHLFVTGQFIHGFPDEFGVHAIHDYWIAGGDVKLWQERFLFRLFVIGQVPYEDDDLPLDEDGDGRVESFARGATDDGTIAGYAINPSITVRPMDGLELVVGSYLLLGHSESKLGMDGAGPSLAYFRARASF
jgi:hypothetical protein